MKKIFLLAVLMVLGVAFSVHAAFLEWKPEGYTAYNRSGANDTYEGDYLGYYNSANYSGYYLGTFAGNTNDGGSIEENRFIDLIAAYLGESFDFDVYKVDEPGTTSGPLTISYEEDYKSGAWTLDTPYELGFYAVKGANEFALYYVEPSEGSGIWWTGHLQAGQNNNIPSISHFSVAPTTARVPEPTVMLLMGAGLAGIVAFGRRRRNNT